MPPKTQYTREEIADIMRQAGWDEKLIPTYSAVAMAESSGRTKAVATRVPLRGGGYSDEYSIGLFQVNMKGKLGADRRRRFGITEKDLEDPVVNARIAKKIYDEEGWQAWRTTFQTGSYKKFLKSNEQDIGRAKVKSSSSQFPTAGADANLTGEATPPMTPLSSYSLPGWMPETRRPADVAPPQPSTPRVTVPPPPRMETPTAPGMRDIAPARTDRLSREDLTPIPSMTPPRTAPPTPRPEPPRAEGLAYVPPTVMYGTPQPEPSTGAGAGAGVSAGVSVGTGAGAGTGAETGAGVEGAVSGQPPQKPTVKGQKVRQGRGPTPGQPILTDSKGNVYQLAPNQKNLPGGKGKRWEIVGGPQYDATETVNGPVRGSTYIQRGQELLSEAMLNADAKAEQEYAKRDSAVAAKVSPFVVTLGGGRLGVKHLLQLTANNPTLRSRVLQQIERAGPMYAENLRQVTINPNAKDLDVPIPFALQAALELNRQGVRLGKGNSEQMIQAALNKGTLKFSGNQLVIGPQQVSALLGPTRSNRVKAAGKYVRRIASEGIAKSDGQFWKDVEEEVGVENFKSADPRLPIASNIGRREADRLAVERMLRIKDAEPALKRAYDEARAALDNPASWKGGKGYDWDTLRQVPTEYRDVMARVIAQNEAGLLPLTEARKTVNDLYKSGNPLYKQAQQALREEGALPPPKSMTEGILRTIVRATTVPAISNYLIKREPTDEDIQRQIQAMTPTVTASMYKDIAEVTRREPESFWNGALWGGLLAAGRNTDAMVFGAVKDLLPPDMQSEWRGRLAAGAAIQEGLRTRDERGWWTNLGQTISQAVLDTPRFLLFQRLGLKNLPVLFAADAMLLARGEDASPEEVQKRTMMGAATGFIFQGAGKFGNWVTKFAKARSAPTRAEFANRMRTLAQQDPEFAKRVIPIVTAIVRNRQGKAGLVPYGTKLASGGRSFTPEEEAQILWDFFTPSEVARLTTAGEKTWKLLSKAIGPVTEIGTVYYGVKSLNSLTGMPEEESEDEALKATILHIAMSGGGKGINFGAKKLQGIYDKMKGRIFRIFHNGKPSDVTITPDNKIVRINQPVPRDMVDAEIVTPGGTFRVREKGRITIKPIRPRGGPDDGGAGGGQPPSGGPPTGGPGQGGGKVYKGGIEGQVTTINGRRSVVFEGPDGPQVAPLDSTWSTRPPTGRAPEAPMPKRDQTWPAGRPVAGMQVVRTFVEQEGKGKKATPNIVEYTGKVLENPDGTLSVEYQTPKGTQVVPLTPTSFAASEPPTGRAKTGTWFLAPGQTMPKAPKTPTVTERERITLQPIRPKGGQPITPTPPTAQVAPKKAATQPEKPSAPAPVRVSRTGPNNRQVIGWRVQNPDGSTSVMTLTSKGQIMSVPDEGGWTDTPSRGRPFQDGDWVVKPDKNGLETQGTIVTENGVQVVRYYSEGRGRKAVIKYDDPDNGWKGGRPETVSAAPQGPKGKAAAPKGKAELPFQPGTQLTKRIVTPKGQSREIKGTFDVTEDGRMVVKWKPRKFTGATPTAKPRTEKFSDKWFLKEGDVQPAGVAVAVPKKGEVKKGAAAPVAPTKKAAPVKAAPVATQKAPPKPPPPPAGPEEGGEAPEPKKRSAKPVSPPPQPAPSKPAPTSAKVGEPPARAEFRIDTPDGKTPASPIKNKPTLPKPTDVPNIIRNKGTDQETSSRDLVRELNNSVKSGITEYNDAVKRYNEALKKNDAKGAAIAKADAEDTARGIRNRLARLDNLQKGRASWEGRAAKPPTEQLPIVRQKEPIVRKRKAEEEIEAPQPPAPSKKIELEPVPGRAPKVGDTVYKPFPYAPDGMFVGKVVKDRFGDGMSVVYINPRTGAKTKVPISSEWSVNKPVAKKGAAVPAKPAPKPEAPVKTKGEKKPAQPKAEEKPAAKKKAPAKPKAEEKPAAKKKAPAKPKAEEKLAPKPKAKEEPVPAGKEQPIEVKERPAPPKRSDADIIAQKEADLQSMKDRLPQAVDKTSRDKLQTRINKLQAEIDNLRGRSTGGDVISPPPSTPTPAPQPPKGGPKAGPKPEPPVKKEDKEAAARLDPNTRAFVRDKIDKWRREEEGGMSPEGLSDILGIPLNVIRAIPEKGELGPFGQASMLMRDSMKNDASPFLKEMIDAVEPRADITNRATAADVVMDALAKLTGKPRSSTMGKAEWDKIYKEVLPKISDESALKLIEAAEWQSKYSQAIRALQTNPQWRSLIDGLRSDFVTSWKQIPEQTKKDLLRIARSVGADYGPRTTKTGDQANIFTNDAIIRAFDETLALRNRPIFEEGISTPNLDAFAQALSRSKEGTLSPRTSDDPTKPFVVAQNGKITTPKETNVIGTSGDGFSAILNQYKIDKALPPETAVALERENRIRENAMDEAVDTLLNDTTGRTLKWTDTGEGIVMVSPTAMALINYAQTSNPKSSVGWYFGQPSLANNIATKVADLARSRYERGDIDWANKAWDLAGTLNSVRMSNPYRDVIVVVDVPNAPNVTALTVMEEAAHRGDIRTRWGGPIARSLGMATPDMPAKPIEFSKTFFDAKAVKRAVDNLPPGYDAYPAEAKGSEVVAKALRNDAEEQLKITPKEREDIIKAFTRLLVKNDVSPQIIHENFSHIGPRADAFTEYYAQQYTKRYPVQGGGAGKVQSDVNDASLQRIWRGWSRPDGPDPAIPAKYNPRIRNEEVGGRTQTVISTPDLDGRTVERVIKHDGQYLRSPNNIEVKLNPEEIYAIERSNDFHRPYMEDNIYAANIRKLPYTIKTKDGEKEFVNIELANMADWARTATSPDTIRKILGPVGKVISIAFTGWNSTKIAIRASADLSSWRQNGKIILSAKPWYRELKETGKRAVEFNAAWDDKIAEIEERQDMMRKIMADPAAMKDNAAKGVTKEQMQQRIAALDKEIAELDKNRIPVTKAMTQLRMKNLFFSHVGSVLAGVKERDWGTSIVGKMKGKKLLPRKAGDRIPAMEFFARRMWADPEYDLIVKEAGLDVGGLLRPEVGMELTDGYNTGILKRFRVDIPGTPKAPNLAAEARIAQQNPEVEIPPYEYDPKTQTWFTFVPRVKVKTGKVVPLTFEWRPFGATTQATHELFGAGFFTRAPYKESKFGRRPFKDVLKSKDPKQILSWLATNARLVPFWPIKASQNAYDTSTAWVRFREMKAQVANLRAMYALEGGRPDIQVFKKAAERINRLGGAFKGDAETRVGEVVNKFIIPVLNWFMFSGRWQLSIQSLFLPGQYTVAPRHVRYENIRGGLQMLGMFALGLGLAQAMADVEVVTDSPTDPGFLRIRIGNEYIGYKTIDISSGLFRYIINYARIINSFYTWFAGPPEPEGLYEAPKDPENPLSATGGIFWNWFSKTLNPRKQDIYAGLTGETVLGEPTTFTEHFLKTSVPIGVENVYDGYVDGTYAWWATSFEGVGLQVTDLPGPDQIKEAQDRDWEKYADDPDEQARRDKLWQQRYEYALRQEERNEERKFNPPTSLLDYLKQFELNEEEMLQQRKEFWERQGWTSPTPPPPSKAQELIDKE